MKIVLEGNDQAGHCSSRAGHCVPVHSCFTSAVPCSVRMTTARSQPDTKPSDWAGARRLDTVEAPVVRRTTSSPSSARRTKCFCEGASRRPSRQVSHLLTTWLRPRSNSESTRSRIVMVCPSDHSVTLSGRAGALCSIGTAPRSTRSYVPSSGPDRRARAVERPARPLCLSASPRAFQPRSEVSRTPEHVAMRTVRRRSSYAAFLAAGAPKPQRGPRRSRRAPLGHVQLSLSAATKTDSAWIWS